MFKIQKRVIYAIEAVLDIALNAGANPVQNITIARRQGIPKRYLEQTLQVLVKNKILVASRGPRGGYRLAKERRKIKILDIINSISNKNENSESHKSELSKIIIEPLIAKFIQQCENNLSKVSIEDIYYKYKEINQNKSDKKVDFVI